MIERRREGYYVLSESGRNLGGPYRNRFLAERRLEQIEYFTRKQAVEQCLRTI